ncbi:BTAD domain-containing putative transcriptional regulator, partial [Streptomyces hundungensis]|uniref:BTAD domain-containing putative transcriptional regulator n=1 Tax=Streptomyces hundungensis TaxID=1077946 RepID=UPI0033E8DEC7
MAGGLSGGMAGGASGGLSASGAGGQTVGMAGGLSGGMAGGLRFRMLGPVEGDFDGRALPLGPPQQRALLAVLLLRAGRPVSMPELLDAIWGERLPPRGVGTLRTYVSRLRTLLEPDRPARTPARLLVSADDGYALRVPATALDTAVFEARLAEAARLRGAGDTAAAHHELTGALALWGGSPLAGLPGPHAERQRDRLTELWLSAREDHFHGALALDRHAATIASLRAFAAEHPLRERTQALLMLALHRAGRQADAFAVYETTRRTLSEELGVPPGPELSALHTRLLNRHQPPAAPDPRHPSGDRASTTPGSRAADLRQPSGDTARGPRTTDLRQPAGDGPPGARGSRAANSRASSGDRAPGASGPRTTGSRQPSADGASAMPGWGAPFPRHPSGDGTPGASGSRTTVPRHPSADRASAARAPRPSDPHHWPGAGTPTAPGPRLTDPRPWPGDGTPAARGSRTANSRQPSADRASLAPGSRPTDPHHRPGDGTPAALGSRPTDPHHRPGDGTPAALGSRPTDPHHRPGDG